MPKLLNGIKGDSIPGSLDCESGILPLSHRAPLYISNAYICLNNVVYLFNVGVRRVERRIMKDLREEVGTKACIVGKLVKSRMKWAGHMVRMKDEKLPKRSETMKHDGCRKRGRPQLRWEDCVKRDLRKAEEEEKWREKANNRDQWKRITKVAVHRSDE